jgi:hypothetical protein
LKLAKMMPCLLQVPAVCNPDPATTVACHSNWGEHGKAKSRRADDCYSAWGCSACHFWLDQGDADAMDKRQIFDAALVRQLEWWERIAEDPTRCEPDRRAARWAIGLIACDESRATPEGSGVPAHLEGAPTACEGAFGRSPTPSR